VQNKIDIFGYIMVCLLLCNISWGWGPVMDPHDCMYCISNGDWTPTPVYVFDVNDPSFPVVDVGKTADSVTVELGDPCNCERFDPNKHTLNLPPFLGSKADVIWDQNDVLVCMCCVFPAYGQINIDPVLSDVVQENHSATAVCPLLTEQYPYDLDCRYYASRADSHYFMAEFDPNVFIVNDNRKSPCIISGSISVNLVGSDCDTLKKALGKTVKISKRKLQSVIIHGFGLNCDIENCGPNAQNTELTKKEDVCEVRVKFVPEKLLESMCPDDPLKPTDSSKRASSSGGGYSSGGGCSLCGGGGDESDLGDVSVGNASAAVGFNQMGILSMYASPDIFMTTGNYGIPSISVPGVWLRATNYPLQASNVIYHPTVTGNAITKIEYSFQVTAQGYNTYHYEFDLTGSWPEEYNTPGDPSTGVKKSKEQVALEAFLDAAKGKVQLTQVTNLADHTILSFQYDSQGRVEKQLSYDENGVENGCIRYGNMDGSSSRIWAGTNESQYVAPGSGNPTGGRWIDVSYNGTGDKKILGSITHGGCSSCRASRVYEKGGPQEDQVTKIKKSDGTVLASYDYDSRGRYTSHSIGHGTGELKVNEWVHGDFDPANKEQTTGNTRLLRRDYVNNGQYRAKVFFADDNGALTKEIHYHLLQDDPDRLTGPYSVYKYHHEKDTSGTLIYVTEYPKGNKLKKYYDGHGNVIKEKWEGVQGSIAEYDYLEITYQDATRYLPWHATNEFGGITSYTHEGFNVKTQTSPVPGAGISSSDQQVVEYTYDAQKRIELEKKKDATGNYVYTKHEYDSVGNLKKQVENYSSTNPSQGLATTYDYNEYNQLFKTRYPSGKVGKKFYSTAGTLIAEAVYENDGDNIAISATRYEYDDGKLESKMIAKMNTSFIFAQTQAESGGNITWVSEVYEYDSYGRKKAVIADAAGKALRTEYEYNNQSEVWRTTYPDKRYKEIVRDGRGLVTKEITGIKQGVGTYTPRATAQFLYDLNGNLVKKVDPMGVTELYQYDNRDKLISSRKGK
jgi:YD repeat-containing protein